MKKQEQKKNPLQLSEYITLIEEVLKSNGRFQLYPRGISMLPIIRQGRDFVYLERLTRPPRRYDILLYRRQNGNFVLHRVVDVDANGICTMCGDNQTALEPGITPEQIIGIATGIGRDGDEPKDGSTGSAGYLFMWCRCRRFRAAVLWMCKLPGRIKRKIEQ